jgi:membrane carboxypeptidase/penicillin-binding protein
MLRFLILATKLSLALAIFGIAVVIAILWHFSQDLPDYSQLK